MDRVPAGPVYRFGPFELDAGRRRFLKDGQLLPLPDRQFDVLLVLCRAGNRLVSKNDLADAAWHGIAVNDNSIDKAISSLRQVLACPAEPAPIEIRKRVGVRLTTPVTHVKESRPAVSVHALLAPLEASVDGRTAIETLDRDDAERAYRTFSQALELEPENAAAHVGLANALLLRFEATRADAEPDRAAVERALHHALKACRLDPAFAEAWSTLACAHHESGAGKSAIAAARKAAGLAPHEWRHHLRRAYVSWGRERLDAAMEVLSIQPYSALGHRFAATVHVARQTFDRAMHHLRAGCAAQDAQPKQTGGLIPVGLHLLHGLVRAAHGDCPAAREEFSRELALEHPDHVYARECAANTWCAIGALALREECRDEAVRAFGEALASVPGHAMAALGRGFAESGSADLLQVPSVASPIDSTFVRAAALVLHGRHADAARLCADALLDAEPGSAGYLLPVEPLLRAIEHRDVWKTALAAVAIRAS
jgi:DNA-binding winged helix-turn-helix (wHTH) protein